MAGLMATMMGSGPRTFPGGLNKYEWAKQQRKRRQMTERAQRQRVLEVAAELRRRQEQWRVQELDRRAAEQSPHFFALRDDAPSARLFPLRAVYSTATYARRAALPHPILDEQSNEGEDEQDE